MLLLYAENITPRLQYIIDFFSNELFDDPIRAISDLSEFKASDQPKLNYSRKETGDDEFYIQSTALLFEKNIRHHKIDCFEINFHKAFFQTPGLYVYPVFYLMHNWVYCPV